MNNSINFSMFIDLLTYEFSKEKEIHLSEFSAPEKTLSIDDCSSEMSYAYATTKNTC